MKKMSLFVMLVVAHLASAQQFVNQVLVLNEGYYDYTTGQIDVPVTLGSYNPATQTYTTLDTIEGARFASDLKIDGDYFYVVADTQVIKYDLNTHEIVATQNVVGARNLLIHGDYIYVTRGEYGVSFDSYLHMYDKEDLTLVNQLDTINGPKYSTQNMVFNDSKLFVAINNAFVWGSEQPLIGVVDLSTFSYTQEIDLGPDGTNPDNMMIDENYIYTVNNKNWSGASFSKVDLNTFTASTINISDVSTGCGTSCLRGGKLNFQLLQDSVLYEWNPVTFLGEGTNIGINNNFYELAHDKLNDLLYASKTDFLSYGKVMIYDSNNSFVSEFDCGVSPGTIAFDVRNSTSMLEFSRENRSLNSLYDLHGKPLNSSENLPMGIYIQSGKKVFKR